MGLWDTVKRVGDSVIEKVQKDAEQRQRMIENAQRNASMIHDDRELVDKFKNSYGFDKVGYATELEKRGYLERDSEGKFQRTSKTL